MIRKHFRSVGFLLTLGIAMCVWMVDGFHDGDDYDDDKRGQAEF
jgi:hypothetical protein